jgi:hypothetical protein
MESDFLDTLSRTEAAICFFVFRAGGSIIGRRHGIIASIVSFFGPMRLSHFVNVTVVVNMSTSSRLN